MFKEDDFIRYGRLVLQNHNGIVDNRAANTLKITLPKLNNIISYFISEALVIRSEDESAQFSNQFPIWDSGLIAIEVKDNVSKPTLKLRGWLRREDEKLREKNVNKFTLLLACFVGIFNLGFSLIPNIQIKGIDVSLVLALLISLLICYVVYKKI